VKGAREPAAFWQVVVVDVAVLVVPVVVAREQSEPT